MASTGNKREEKTQDRAIEKTIEESKGSTNKLLNEAKRELPEFTAAFHDYQEQNIEAIKEMTGTFLESQKEVATSIHSATLKGQRPSATIAMNWMLWPYGYWANPQGAVEVYSKAATNFADTTIAAARLSNEMVIASMETTRAFVQHELKDTKAISKYIVDTARDIEAGR